ncbi:MAG TPA: MBL fold metallo-hydrolase [Candidatus Acidoferrales bacterium]
MAKITFLGAAGTVTGSKYLIEAGGKKLLVDCGLFQGAKELTQRNWNVLPVDIPSIDWVVVTHAHIDHTGYLPKLVKAGYKGPIYCDAATRELCQLLLLDSAHLQEEDAKFAAKMKYSSHPNPLPLYTTPDAQAALNQFKEIPRSDSFTISPEFSVRTHDAGHILGSCWLELTITENGKQMVIVFSGDVGRYDQPILNDPTPPSRADFLLCESTYGDRDHPAGSVADALADAINRVAKRGGAVVIPSFAVGRTQTLMWYLRQLDEAKRIPQIPVFVDSPMAIGVTDIYARHKEDHDLDFNQAEQQGNKDPLNLREVKMTRSVDDSKAINNVASCIIISASGMATGGRILHHLVQRLPDAKNAVLLVGYQGEGTNGRALQDGAQFLRIHGQEVAVKAEIVTIDQLSAHAGRSELLRWLSGFTAAPRQTFLVHGEPIALESFRAAITTRMKWPVTVPAYLQSFDLNP